jgi:hypothetical protein
MAYKRLATEEMVQVSSPWVKDGTEARKAILAVPLMASVLPKVEAAHQGLHAAQPGGENPRLAELQKEAFEEDQRHDTVVRGIHTYLTGLATLSGDTGGELLQLRDFLLPEGLEAIQKSYRAEAGAGDLLQTRLGENPGVKKQLKDIPVLKKNLAHYVDQWLASARRLGSLEDERAQIVLGPAGPSDAENLVKARHQWIRAVNALVANAELAGLDPAADRLIFGPLHLAEKAADRRGKLPVAPAGEEPDKKPE